MSKMNLIFKTQGITLRRCQQERRSAISDDYVVCQEEIDAGIDNDPVSWQAKDVMVSLMK